MMTVFVTSEPDGTRRVSLRSSDSLAFSMAIEALKRFIPSWARSFDGETKEWVISWLVEECFQKWRRYVSSELGAHVEGWEARERRQSRGAHHPPRPSRDDPFRVLHLLPSAPAELVRAARKVLALKAHPDAGGDGESMKLVNSAADEILSRLDVA